MTDLGIKGLMKCLFLNDQFHRGNRKWSSKDIALIRQGLGGVVLKTNPFLGMKVKRDERILVILA